MPGPNPKELEEGAPASPNKRLATITKIAFTMLGIVAGFYLSPNLYLQLTAISHQWATSSISFLVANEVQVSFGVGFSIYAAMVFYTNKVINSIMQGIAERIANTKENEGRDWWGREKPIRSYSIIKSLTVLTVLFTAILYSSFVSDIQSKVSVFINFIKDNPYLLSTSFQVLIPYGAYKACKAVTRTIWRTIGFQEVSKTDTEVSTKTSQSTIDVDIANSILNELQNAPPYLPKNVDVIIKSIDVAGYEPQLRRIIREVLFPLIRPKLSRAYGVAPVKGLLLYGPPGTGKTTIARSLGRFFGKVIYISAAELKSKWMGETEANIRAIFAPAKEAYQAYLKAKKAQDGNKKIAKCERFVIVFDELDATLTKRSAIDRTSSFADKASNSATSQFIAELDGLVQFGNIIVIATTNNKDNLDEALLRPSRLGVQIEIGLPIEKDRLAILNAKTSKLQDQGLLDSSVTLSDWAKRTENFSGDDLKHLAKLATDFAMEASDASLAGNYYDGDENSDDEIDNEYLASLTKINQAHFEQAFAVMMKDRQSRETVPLSNHSHFSRRPSAAQQDQPQTQGQQLVACKR